MHYRYNDHLYYICWVKTRKYGTDCWFDFPNYLQDGTVRFALKLVCEQQIYYHAAKIGLEELLRKLE